MSPFYSLWGLLEAWQPAAHSLLPPAAFCLPSPHAPPPSSGVPAVFLGKPHLEAWAWEPQVWSAFRTWHRWAAAGARAGLCLSADGLRCPPLWGDRLAPLQLTENARPGQGVGAVSRQAVGYRGRGRRVPSPPRGRQRGRLSGRSHTVEEHLPSPCRLWGGGDSDKKQKTNAALLTSCSLHSQGPAGGLREGWLAVPPGNPADSGPQRVARHTLSIARLVAMPRGALVSDTWIHQPDPLARGPGL